MNLLKNVFWITILLLIYTISGFLFKVNHTWMSIVVFISAFISAYIYFKNNNVAFFKGFFILTGLVLLIDVGVLFAGGLPHIIYPYIIFIPISNFLGWCFAKTYNKIYILVAVFFVSFASFIFLPNVTNYANNKNPRKNKPFPEISLIDGSTKEVKLKKDKIIILDFWTTSCGVCFEKFPDLEAVYLKYKNNPDVEIYSVNIPLRRDNFNKTVDRIKKLGYTFPTLYATSSNEAERDLNIRAYPHFVILKNNKIRYNGSLNIDKNIFVYNTYNEIDRIINER